MRVINFVVAAIGGGLLHLFSPIFVDWWGNFTCHFVELLLHGLEHFMAKETMPLGGELLGGNGIVSRGLNPHPHKYKPFC